MTTWTPSGEAVTEIILETFRLNGRLLAVGDRMTRPLGQSSARWQVLGAISEGPQTVPEAAHRMGLTRQSVQRTADLLAAEGLVEFALNPRHRRSRLVGLTRRGRSLYARITRRQVSWANRLAKGLSASDLRRAAGLLRALRTRLE